MKDNYTKDNYTKEKGKGNDNNPFVRVSILLNDKYSPRQLCHYWRNYLDPERK